MELHSLLEERFQRLSSHLGVSGTLTSESRDRLLGYLEMLARWSKRIDLVSPGTPEQLLERHLIDSLAADLLIPWRPTGAALDIGTGAGLPGLVFAILHPEQQLYLCEPREKRVLFLKEAKRQLGLTNVEVLRQRLEELEPPEQLWLVATRALGQHELFLTHASRLLPSGGVAVQLVGPSFVPPQESAELSLINDLHYTLPTDGAARRLAVWQKNGERVFNPLLKA